jgi:hypothetical protein
MKAVPYFITTNTASALSKMAWSDMCNNFLNSNARLLKVNAADVVSCLRRLDWHLLPLLRSSYPPYLPKSVSSQSSDQDVLTGHYSVSSVAVLSWCSYNICSCLDPVSRSFSTLVQWRHSISPAFSLAKAIRAPQTFFGLISVGPDVNITLTKITSR